MSLGDADKIVAYIEARVRPTICPTYSSAGKQSIEGRITRDDFDHLIGLVQSLRASQAKMVEAAAQICERRAARHAADRKRIEATPGHDQAIIDACIAAEDEANEAAVDIRVLAEPPGGQT